MWKEPANTPEQKVRTCFMSSISAAGRERRRLAQMWKIPPQYISRGTPECGHFSSCFCWATCSQGRFLIISMKHGVKDEVHESVRRVVLDPAARCRLSGPAVFWWHHRWVAADFSRVSVSLTRQQWRRWSPTSDIQLEINISVWLTFGKSRLCYELIFQCCNMRVKEQLWLLTTSLCETAERGSNTHITIRSSEHWAPGVSLSRRCIHRICFGVLQ